MSDDQEIKKYFSLPDSEKLIEFYFCTLWSKKNSVGEMIMSCNYLLFRPLNDDQSNLIKFKLHFNQIHKIEKTYKILSKLSGIKVILKDNRKFNFNSFFPSRNQEAKQLKKNVLNKHTVEFFNKLKNFLEFSVSDQLWTKNEKEGTIENSWNNSELLFKNTSSNDTPSIHSIDEISFHSDQENSIFCRLDEEVKSIRQSTDDFRIISKEIDDEAKEGILLNNSFK